MKVKNATHAGSPARRQDIILAALACFTEAGFAETSMADIRRRSNASTGSIYHHFKSKEQLAAEVYLEGIRDYQDGFLAVLEEHHEAHAGILAVIAYHVNWVSEHPDWTRYLFQMARQGFMASVKEVFAGLNAEFMKRCAQWVGGHVNAGTMRRLPADMYVSLLLGPLMEYTRLFLVGQTCTNPDQAVHVLGEAAWRCLGREPREGSAQPR
jgi:AcrR family transcriptional regulator